MEKRPSCTAYFAKFANEHSWYKLAMPTEFGVTLLADRTTDQLTWFCHRLDVVLARTAHDPVQQQIVRDNSFLVNGLVYRDQPCAKYYSTFYHTLSIGGDSWFEWLESMYPQEAGFIKQHSIRNDIPDCRGERWRLSWDAMESPETGLLLEAAIKTIKAKEYSRLLNEFKLKASKVWEARNEAINSPPTDVGVHPR